MKGQVENLKLQPQNINNNETITLNQPAVIGVKPLKLLNKLSVSSILKRKANNVIVYNFNKNNNTSKFVTNATTILNYFSGSFYFIISKPLFLFNSNKVIINLNYYKPEPSLKLSNRYIWKYSKVPSRSAKGLQDELFSLIDILSNLFKMKVEFQLNQLKYPFHDSTILSKLISLNSRSKRYIRLMKVLMKKASIINKKFSNSPIAGSGANSNDSNFDFWYLKKNTGKSFYVHKSTPTVLTGLKIKISGRLTLQRIIPKRTISKTQVGNFASSNSNIVDYGIYTNKNKKGAYSIKVWSTHRIVQ